MSHSSSPGASPTKVSNSTSILPPLNHISPKSQSVRNKVARLSISETAEVKKDLLHSLNHNNNPYHSSSNSNIKRRRSSAALGNPSLNLTSISNTNDDNKSRQNSITSGKVVKKKKRNSANKPLDIKILDKFFHSEEQVTQNSNNHFNPNHNLKRKYRISIKDIRDLVVFLMNGTNNSPQWVNVANRGSINKLVVLFMPGLEPQDYNLPKDSSFFVNGTLLRKQKLQASSEPKEQSINHVENVAVCAPGSRLSLFSAYNSFINVGLSKNEKIALKNDNQNNASTEKKNTTETTTEPTTETTTTPPKQNLSALEANNEVATEIPVNEDSTLHNAESSKETEVLTQEPSVTATEPSTASSGEESSVEPPVESSVEPSVMSSVEPSVEVSQSNNETPVESTTETPSNVDNEGDIEMKE